MQQVWRKRWRLIGLVALGAITLVLLVSAVHNKNHKICNGIEVSFSGDGSTFFVDEKGVVAVLKSYRPIKGEAIDSIDIKALEDRLKQDKWIANADLFFDNKQVLQVRVEEKEPVARIFTVGGSSFYIDSACRRLPLSEKRSARIPMFTSFPSDRAILSKPDSLLLANAKNLAMFIKTDDLWKAQVAQIDITPEGFEMIPTIGSHVVELGKDGDWQQKFDRLFSFYKQVWTKVGFEKYGKIDVQFDGQVVATLKGSKPAMVDSAKARMAYENLLAEVKKSDKDSLEVPAVRFAAIEDTAKTKVHDISKEANVKNKTKPPLKVPALTASKKAAVKTGLMKMEVAKPSAKQIASNKKPDDKKVAKAMMKKKTI